MGLQPFHNLGDFRVSSGDLNSGFGRVQFNTGTARAQPDAVEALPVLRSQFGGCTAAVLHLRQVFVAAAVGAVDPELDVDVASRHQFCSMWVWGSCNHPQYKWLATKSMERREFFETKLLTCRPSPGRFREDKRQHLTVQCPRVGASRVEAEQRCSCRQCVFNAGYLFGSCFS